MRPKVFQTPGQSGSSVSVWNKININLKSKKNWSPLLWVWLLFSPPQWRPCLRHTQSTGVSEFPWNSMSFHTTRFDPVTLSLSCFPRDFQGGASAPVPGGWRRETWDSETPQALNVCLHVEVMICQVGRCTSGTWVKSLGVYLRTEGFVFVLFLLFAQRIGDL